MAKKTKSAKAAASSEKEEASFKTEREEALEAEKRRMMEDEEEEEEMKTSSSSSSSAEAAASLASAATQNEGNTVKNFRHHPDIESFYRFIYENDLRLEGLQIINQFLDQKRLKKGVKIAKSQAH